MYLTLDAEQPGPPRLFATQSCVRLSRCKQRAHYITSLSSDHGIHACTDHGTEEDDIGNGAALLQYVAIACVSIAAGVNLRKSLTQIQVNVGNAKQTCTDNSQQLTKTRMQAGAQRWSNAAACFRRSLSVLQGTSSTNLGC